MLTNEQLGNYLKNVRESLGYSTRDVNKLCDISQSYISLMENGKRKASPIILKKLSTIYHIDYIELYEKAGYIELLEGNYNKIEQSKEQTIYIPILGTVKAGYNYLAQENWIGSVEIERSVVGNEKDFFALKVKRR